MTEYPVFECNVTGDRFGAKNDVIEFDIRRHGNNEFDLRSRTVHISLDALEAAARDGDVGVIPRHVEYVGVKEGQIVGAALQRQVHSSMVFPNPEDASKINWHDRDSGKIDHHEAFFEFVEEEVLYDGSE